MIFTVLFLILLTVMFVILLSSSFKIINYITIFHSLFIILLSIYLFLKVQLPVTFLENNYILLDILSLYEIFITGVIFFFASVYAGGYIECLINDNELSKKNVKLFYLVYNALLFMMILVFSSNNLSLLWIFAEITTILSAILIVTLNAKDNILAAMKYVFITSTAMLFSFIGLIFLYSASNHAGSIGTLNWNELMLISQQIPPQLLIFSFVFIFIGFAAKSGIVPFHTWLPSVYAKSPSDVSVLLSGAIHNVGLYAIIRAYTLIAPTSMGNTASLIMLIFGILTIGVASLSMIVRTNLKKLIAFSSIETMGFMLIGIALGNIFWVLYFMLANALIKAVLFFSAGIIHRQYNSVRVGDINNIFKLQPLAAVGLIIGSIAIIGTPLFPIFMPKFYILASLIKISIISVVFVLLFLLIAVSGYVWLIIRLVTQQGKTKDRYFVYLSMKMPIIILIICLLILGVYFPQPLADTLNLITLQLGF